MNTFSDYGTSQKTLHPNVVYCMLTRYTYHHCLEKMNLIFPSTLEQVQILLPGIEIIATMDVQES